MNQDAAINRLTRMVKSLQTEIAELRAEIAQLGPVQKASAFDEELRAAIAQGVDLATYYHQKGKSVPRRRRTKANKQPESN